MHSLQEHMDLESGPTWIWTYPRYQAKGVAPRD